MTLEHSTPRIVHVVAGVVIDASQRVLIAQRPAGKHLAGAWEFPGGKLEPGEARAQGLARELREEIGIAIRQPRPLIRLRHSYPYGEVLLDVWVVRRYSGDPRGLDGQRLRWCSRAELASADLLPADRPILAALRLPERLRLISTPFYRVGGDSNVLQDRPGADRSARGGSARGAQSSGGAKATRRTPLLGVFCSSAGEAAAAAGTDFFVMREALPNGELAELCDAVDEPVFARGVALERAWALGASGINALVC